MVAQRVVVAERLHPDVLAGLQIDRGHPRVGRLEQRQALGHLGPPAAAAVGVAERAALERIGRVERDHAERVARWHVEPAGFRVDRGAVPVRAAPGRRPEDRAPLAAGFGQRRRRVERADPVVLDHVEGHLPDLGREVGQVVLGHALVLEGRRLRREGLGGRGGVAGHRRRRRRPILDRPHGLARDAVEYVEEALLADLGDDLPGIGARRTREVDQRRSGREVVVPEAVADSLEVPELLARFDVDRDEALGVEVVARAVATVEVVRRGADRQVDDAVLVVAGEHGPDVRVAGVAPGLVLPGLDALVTLLGHGAEHPAEFARARVPAAHPARDGFLRDPAVGDRGAGDDHVADHDRRRLHGVEQGVQVVPLAAVGARQALHQVDTAAVAEVLVRAAGTGVDREQVAVAGAPVDAAVGFVAVLAVRPVGDAALVPDHGHRRRALLVALRVVGPDRPAAAGVDRGPDRDRRVQEEQALLHQRRRLQVADEGGAAGAPEQGIVVLQPVEDDVPAGVPLAAGLRLAQEAVHRPPAPGDLEVAEVIGVDLVQRRVLGRTDVPAVARPFAGRRAALGGCRRGQKNEGARRGDGDSAHVGLRWCHSGKRRQSYRYRAHRVRRRPRRHPPEPKSGLRPGAMLAAVR